ncbi:hypothetical protein AB4Y89_24300 [Terriglobus sp. 2YAB30_2]|uniref:hypothetical protein n=1 Tax=Terriglobus sp. 2YAB30_2 TaxID=3233023 RepID=UPI003F957371
MLRKPASVQIARIEVLESNILAPQAIEFDRLIAIVGSHGAGKSLTLRLIEGAFGNVRQTFAPPFMPEYGQDEEPLLSALPHPITATVNITVIRDHVHITVPIDISEGPSANKQKWADALGLTFKPEHIGVPYMLSELFTYLQYYEEHATHAAHRGNGAVSPAPENLELLRSYRRKDLDAVRNILGKVYESASSFGWKYHDNKWIEPFPHIIAETASGRRIDNLMMSLGELWTHWLFGWCFIGANGWPRLLDEPESFLAQRGHRPLIDEVFRRCLEHDNQLVVATHSPQILSRFPLNNIRLCLPSADGILIAPAKSASQIFDLLGATGSVRIVVLVEDDMASHILGDLFAELDWNLARQLEIVQADGESMVIAGLRAMRNAREIGYVGILDGDCRGRDLFPKSKVGVETAEYLTQRVLYLPGSQSPETELAQAAAKQPERLAQLLNRETIDIATAAASCADLDHQYWLARYARTLGLPQDVVRHNLVRIWLTSETVMVQANELIHSLRALVDRS